MMLKKCLALAPVFALCACATPMSGRDGHGEDAPLSGVTHRHLAKGYWLELGSYVTIDKTCKMTSVPQISVTQRPRHGSVRIYRKSGYGGFDRNGPHGACADVKYPGLAVRYTPARGYAGQDAFAYRVRFANGEIRNIGFALTIGE